MFETSIAAFQSLIGKLGWCPRCMRTSFTAAAVAAVVASVVTYASPDFWTVAISWAGAASLIGLWIAHLVAFSVRAAIGIQTNATPEIALAGANVVPVGVTFMPRRNFLSNLLKAFAFAALATALPGRFADAAPCKVVSCSDPKCRCVAPSSRCVTCPARNQVGCTTNDAVVCCSVQAFWTCPSRHDCFGDGTNRDRCRPWR